MERGLADLSIENSEEEAWNMNGEGEAQKSMYKYWLREEDDGVLE